MVGDNTFQFNVENSGLLNVHVEVLYATGSAPAYTPPAAIDAPAPQGRYLLNFDSRAYANGDYELFVQATSPSGQKGHPSYGDETHHFDVGVVSGAYYPMPIRIQN